MSKVLLLEPDTLLGRIYQQALEAVGHKVSWCQNAQAAISATDSIVPDVIVAELQLAAHSGIEFLYELRSYREWQTIPVIITSQIPPHSKGINAKTLQQLGVIFYHYKPLTKLKDLLESVAQVPALA